MAGGPRNGRWVVVALLALGVFAMMILYFGSLWITGRPRYRPAVGQAP